LTSPKPTGISSITNLIKSYQQRTGKPKELGECAGGRWVEEIARARALQRGAVVSALKLTIRYAHAAVPPGLAQNPYRLHPRARV